MIGDEARVVHAFCTWLESRGWTTAREIKHVDVVGTRGEQHLYAEAKGRTAAMGLDINTLYGQLLRRMPVEEPANTSYAVVVPDAALKLALDVPERIRQLLGIHVYGVSETGDVRHIGGETDPTELR